MMNRTLRIAMASLALAATCISNAAAEGVPRGFWGAPALPDADSSESMSVEELQTLLLWVGFYYGAVDGLESNELSEAVDRFQASIGDVSDGRLSSAQSATLRKRAERARQKADFKLVHDPWTGIAAPLPLGYLGPPSLDQSKDETTVIAYPARGSSDLSVKFVRFENMRASPKRVFDILMGIHKKNKENKDVYGKLDGNYFYIRFVNGATASILIYQLKDNEARGVQILHPTSRTNIFAPVQMQIFSGIDHFRTAGFKKSERDKRIAARRFPGYEDQPDWRRTMVGSGSGSIVSLAGHILSNHHVVDGCRRLTVNGNEAILIGVDIVNDLALLQAKNFARRAPVRFRRQDARLGEDIVVIGYPIFGTSRSLNVTTGVVSARSGLYGDRRNIQITAPVQPGNSGGPVLDKRGQQVAVVVAKASAALQSKGNVENMAWVIRGDIAIEFLEDHGVTPIMDDERPQTSDSISAVADQARGYTVRIECHSK